VIRHVVACFVALLICAMAAAPVEATQATLTYLNSVDPGAIVDLDAPINAYGWAGQYQFEVTATDDENLIPLGQLGAYCIDLAQEPDGSSTYTLVPLTQAPVPPQYGTSAITGAQETQLKKLWSRHHGEIGSDLTKDFLAASFNLAVWEIIYEHSGALNAKTGTFRTGGGTWSGHPPTPDMAAQANEWLGDLGSWQVGEEMPDLRALVNPTHQDMLYIIVGGGDTYVPEPLTMLGMFLGLGSVGAYIRRRRMA